MKKIFFAAALAGAAMLASCGGNKSGVQMGSLSDFDSLSYSLGANIGYGMSYEMKDIPFDFKLVDKGIKEGAMGKASQEHDKSLDMLREYFEARRACAGYRREACRCRQRPSGRRRFDQGRVSRSRSRDVRERRGAR